MRLKTLGGLELEGSDFRRPQPLLLLAYLALEGSKDRQFLSELFWWNASNPRNNLSSTLTRLRSHVPNNVHADNYRVWVSLDIDIRELKTAFDQNRYQDAVALYTGSFLEGIHISDLNQELEEWIYVTREFYAKRVRLAFLKRAEQEAKRSNFEEASSYAEQAYTLKSTPPLEPEELNRYYTLLILDDNEIAHTIRREAEEYGIRLNQTQEQAKSQLEQPFIGRENELERIKALQSGEWAWVRGGLGMGKTSFLKNMEGTYLKGRSGLPFATLEPVANDVIKDGAETLLRYLLYYETRLIIDDWEQADEESRNIVERLRSLHPNNNFIISSRDPPRFSVDVLIELGPLPKEKLRTQGQVYEKTGGIPRLVTAQLKGESLSEAFEAMLSSLDQSTQQIYLALSLLDSPNPSLVRQALKISASDMNAALKHLTSAGLTDLSGQLSSVFLANHFLTTKPQLLGALSLELGRQLDGQDAFPLYQKAKEHWGREDIVEVQKSYLAWSEELMSRGFPLKAAEVLREVPPNQDVEFMRAYALEQAGKPKLALDILEHSKQTPKVSALLASIYRRLGKPIEAEKHAQLGLNGEAWERAYALNTLGELAKDTGAYSDAISFFKRAKTLWLSLSNRLRAAHALNNIAIIYYLQGKPNHLIDTAYHEALSQAEGNIRLRIIVFSNLAIAWERAGQLTKAKVALRESASLAEEINLFDAAADAWNNLGYFYHRQNSKVEAESAYRKALLFAQKVNEKLLLGIILANLAELNMDFDAWTEALNLLTEAKHDNVAQNFWNDIPEEHPFKASLKPAL